MRTKAPPGFSWRSVNDSAAVGQVIRRGGWGPRSPRCGHTRVCWFLLSRPWLPPSAACCALIRGGCRAGLWAAQSQVGLSRQIAKP